MNPKSAPSSSRKAGALSGIRSLVLALSVTSTLALWAIFSKIDRDKTTVVDPLPMTTTATVEESASEVFLNLPPIPTLIPTTGGQAAAPLQDGIPPVTRLATPIVPQFVKPVKITSRDNSGREGSQRPDRSNGGSGGGGGGGGSTGSSK